MSNNTCRNCDNRDNTTIKITGLTNSATTQHDGE